ncbi:MAG: restriction endonuclease subunit S [Deltaproteobacteria bacterium]|nr:restriction endonuclease subunit S [Deltaproteobacteria bacterium]
MSFVPMEAIGERGEFDASRQRPIAEVEAGFTCFQDGDVLVAKITPCFENGKGAIACGLLGGIGFGTTELHVLRPSSDLDARFLFYVTASHSLRTLGAASMYGAAGQQRVGDGFLRDYLVGLPQLDVQRRIAAYLDRKTAAIDGLIAKKERLIELLEEKRQAAITQAVTKGLDPGVPMKQSGIGWLPVTPAHWAIARVKHEVVGMTSGSRGWSEYFAEEGAVFLQSGNLDRQLGLDLSAVQHVKPPATAEVRRTAIAPGDVLICITGALTGNVGLVREPLGEAYVNQHLALVRPRTSAIVPAFLTYALGSLAGQAQLAVAQYGLKQGLGLADVADVMLGVPPIAEQRLIVRTLDNALARSTDAGARLQMSVGALREYRQALITAAVTGQIDVANMADDRDDVVEKVEADGET